MFGWEPVPAGQDCGLAGDRAAEQNDLKIESMPIAGAMRESG